MLDYTGFMYQHVALRLRNLDIEVSLATPAADELSDSDIFRMYSGLEELSKFLVLRSEQNSKDLETFGKHLVIRFLGKEKNEESDFLSMANTTFTQFKVLTYPFRNSKFTKMLSEGQVSMHFNRRMPKGWKKVMAKHLEKGAIDNTVGQFKPRDHNVNEGYRMVHVFKTLGKHIPLCLVETKGDELRRGGRRLSEVVELDV